MFAKQIADYFGFSKYFDFIGGACMNESRTDKYEVIEYVIESCNITDRNEVVMVGDRSHDMIGAKKAGLHSIGVLYGYGSKKNWNSQGGNVSGSAGTDCLLDGSLIKTLHVVYKRNR